MKRKTREEKAITLIALIITIVVLLILAVVAINAVTGDGIIQHATNAKTSYKDAQNNENSTIQGYMNFLKNEVSEIEGKVKLITFIIYNSDEGTNVEYQAEEGMTWEEWVNNSKYNSANYYTNEYNVIYSSDGQYTIRYHLENSVSMEHVTKDMMITDGEEYFEVYIYEGDRDE